jgi:hypothetical protein
MLLNAARFESGLNFPYSFPDPKAADSKHRRQWEE